MAKKKKKTALDNAKDLADMLLYKTTNGSMGKKCDGEVNFTEMRSLLETMIKISALEAKQEPEEEDQPSAFDLIQKEVKNGSKKVKSGSLEATTRFFENAKRAELARSEGAGEVN